jgi:hypothetical protein
MLGEMISLGPRGVATWQYIAPLVEAVLNRPAEARGPRQGGRRAAIAAARRALERLQGAGPSFLDEAQINAWLDAAEAHAVLSYAQSFAAARVFVEAHLDGSAARSWEELAALATGGAVTGGPPVVSMDFWSVREGHTSSVWRVALRCAGGAEVVLCLNVARDRESGRELVWTAQEMRRLHAIAPGSVLGVLACETLVGQTAGGPAPIPVVAVPWLEGAQELQVVRDPPRDSGLFLIVDRFEARGSASPGRQFPLGQILDPDASEALFREQLALRVKLTRFEDDGAASTPFFEMNEGDLVWRDGLVTAIAVSEPEPALPLGLWALRLLLTSTHDGAGGATRIFWNRPESAIEVIDRALTGRADRPFPRRYLAAALAVSDRQCEGLRGASPDPAFARYLARARAAARAELQRLTAA